MRVRRYLVALAVLATLAALPAQGATAAHRSRARAAQSAGLTATLLATVTSGSIASLVSFEYGTSTAYGSETGTTVVLAGLTLTVSDTISGLQAGVTYHYRVAATGLLGTSYGADETFTIAADTGSGDGSGGTVSVTTTTTVDAGSGGASVSAGAGASGSGASAGLGVGVTGPSGTTGASGTVGVTVGSGAAGGDASSGAAGGPGASTASVGPPPPPTLDQTAVVDKTSGVVFVTVPGSNVQVPIAKSASVPSGSIIDADRGIVRITTALDGSGKTQSVVVADGSARVRYDAASEGRVNLRLVGGNFAVCRAVANRARASAASVRSTRAARSPAKASSQPVRSLWASDDHGRYTTQGNDSVATVRGTVWLTQDWCDGTLTRVARGLVSVHDTHAGRTVLVHAGHSYFARD